MRREEQSDRTVAVETVRGPVPLAELGMTLMHEHLLCDWTARMAPPEDPRAREEWHRPVDASAGWLLTEDPGARVDNARLDSVGTAVEEIANFSDLGGRTIVECTNGDIGRDPRGLREISERSGVNIVMGSGWYVHAFHSAGEPGSIEQLCEELSREFAIGVGGTGIKPGIIGEIGVSPQFTDAEQRRLRAASRVQREVGVPLLIHMPGWLRRADEVLDVVLDQEGVSPSAVVLCHMDPSGPDPDYQLRAARRGVWLEFDMIGMSTYYDGEGQSPSPDETAAAIARLARDGHADRILLSHDVSTKSMWTRNGGNGLGYVPRLFVPRLVRHGVAADAAQAMITENPAGVFAAAALAVR